MIEIPPADPLPDGARLVVAPLPTKDAMEWAQASPEVGFIFVGAGPDVPPDNAVALAPSGLRPDLPAFAAGVVAATVTEDWRAGVAVLGSGPEAEARRLASLNGVEYVCGLCRPAYPPFLPYPIDASPPKADPEAAVSALLEAGVTTAYLYADSESQRLFDLASQAGLRLVGEISPTVAWQDLWVASVGFDLRGALSEAWRDLSQSQGGYTAELPVALKDVNPTILTQGRRRAVEVILSDLNRGYIGTGTRQEDSSIAP